MNYSRDKNTLLTVYFLFYYGVFLSFFFNHRLLSQYQPVFFNYNRDLTELSLIATGLPRFMIGHPWTFWAADALLYLLPLPLLIRYIRKGAFALSLGIPFSLFLGVYLLLANIFWQCHLEPFILYFLLSFLFLTNREDRFYGLLKGARLYFLYIFFSAAVWKIARGAIFNGQEMSDLLLLQHSELLISDPGSLASRVYAWLIDHPVVSWWLYFGALALEASFIIGLFTRRYDRILLALAVLFVGADLLVMRLPYWTVLLGGITLWMRPEGKGPQTKRPETKRGKRSAEKKLLLYETTHHENLPALLDLSETHFDKVTVFLKELSYRNVCGSEDPVKRWSRTVFFSIPDDYPNRRSILKVFSFLKKNAHSHFHLATLDNNLLLFSLMLYRVPSVHISLTLHEINEYFAGHVKGFRDLTESIAKLLLRRRIRHYHFFLPAMVEHFRQKMPAASAVFIPSRFYRQDRVPQRAEPSPFVIVIPGSVDPGRRDYEAVAAFFSHYCAHAAPSSPVIELVILGNSDTPYGTGVRSRLQQLESPSFRVSFYSGYIPETVYEQRLGEADLIWSPLKVYKKSIRNSPETYGLTTASGLTADLLLTSAPALVPSDLIIPEPFRAALIPYRSPEEWQDRFVRLINDPAYRLSVREEIRASYGLLTKERFAPSFLALMGLDEKGKEGGTDPGKPVGDQRQ